MTEQKQRSAQMMSSPILKRSVMLLGHKTSISLEEPFWQALQEIAAERGNHHGGASSTPSQASGSRAICRRLCACSCSNTFAPAAKRKA